MTISGGNGQGDLLFGDCNGDTLLCQSGYVTEGTIIGYTGGDAYDGPLGYSSGAHCHVEYWPEGYFQGNVSDPVPILMTLGVDLTGAIVGPGGQSGKHGRWRRASGEFREKADLYRIHNAKSGSALWRAFVPVHPVSFCFPFARFSGEWRIYGSRYHRPYCIPRFL